ncbi:MAG: KUP/HAK/KT family potassium transporter [Sediminibacterium sp.]
MRGRGSNDRITTLAISKTWQGGREIVAEKMRREERKVAGFIETLERDPPLRTPGVSVVLTSNTSNIPRTLVRNLKMNGVLHEHTISSSLVTECVPRIGEGGQVKVLTLASGLYRVIARAGVMEFPEIPKLLRAAHRELPVRTDLVEMTSSLVPAA